MKFYNAIALLLATSVMYSGANAVAIDANNEEMTLA